MADYRIECDLCASGDIEHREDCLIAMLEGIEAEDASVAVFDEIEVRALRALRDGGLLPTAMKLPDTPMELDQTAS